MKSELKKGTPRKTKITLIVILVAGISLLHYLSDKSLYYYHIFYGELYFLPIVLTGFWFGLRGALAASLGISACYIPFVYWHWQGFSPEDFDRILSLLLYNASAVLIGVLKNREVIANKRLLETERLVAMGKSLAAVAHDMKTPLVAIGGLTRRLQKKFKENDPDREKSDIIMRETERLEKMMHNMLDFSKPLALQLSHGDINEIIETSTTIVNETAQKKEVAIECKLSHDLPKVAFDEIRMKQVIANLALNAVEASPEGEIVTIRTTDANYKVIIDVADCGDGISLDLRTKVFDPFFTTKKEGTGLGLAIIKKIMDAHEGSLEIVDNSPKGTIFRIILPKSDNKVLPRELLLLKSAKKEKVSVDVQGLSVDLDDKEKKP